MKKTLNSILIIGLFLISGSLKAQVLPIQEVQIALTPLTPLVISDAVMDTLTDPFYLIQQDSILNVSLSIILQDTADLNIIHVKLGTTSGGSELMTQTFNYDGSAIGSGLTFSKELNNVTLGLGTQPNINNALYFVEVKLEDINGTQSVITTTDTSQ